MSGYLRELPYVDLMSSEFGKDTPMTDSELEDVVNNRGDKRRKVRGLPDPASKLKEGEEVKQVMGGTVIIPNMDDK